MENLRYKFRAWDKERKSMQTSRMNMVSFNGDILMAKRDEWRSSDIVLMQFTGLLDKSGREIYEGDVVEIPYQTDDIECIHRVVYWDEEGARFSTAQEQDCDDDDILAKGIKVIGNIYEHGDLLDGK